jgi:hypothetical protein
MQYQFLGHHLPANAEHAQVPAVVAVDLIAQARFDGLHTKADQPHIEQTPRQGQARQALEMPQMGGFGIDAMAFQVAKHFFNGLITNDKFCMSRVVQLKLTWSRRPLRCREQDPGDQVYSGDEQVHHGGAYETSLDCSTRIESGSGRRIPLGSSVPTPSAMDLATPTDTKFVSITSPGGV